MDSDKSPTRSTFVGQYLTLLDFKTSSLAFSDGMRWSKKICGCSLGPQPIRIFLKSECQQESSKIRN